MDVPPTWNFGPSSNAAYRIRVIDLPTELLRAVFLWYYELTAAPIVLLFVCRQWRDAALDISAIWRTIRFIPRNRRYSIPTIDRTMHLRITCLTWGQLVAAANRAGGAMISISCDLQEFDASIGANNDVAFQVFPRCHKLCIYFGVSRGPIENFVKSFHGFFNLEELYFDGFSSDHSSSLGPFLQGIERQSQRLSVMSISGSCPPDLPNYSSLLSCVRKFSLSSPVTTSNGIDLEQILTGLVNVKVLGWSYGFNPGLHFISDNLQSLHITSCSMFPSLSFRLLSSLILDYSLTLDYSSTLDYDLTYLRTPDPDYVELPVLLYLEFRGFWDKLGLLRAPLLQSLVLRLHPDRNLTVVPTIRPKKLTINDTIPYDKLLEVLGGIWSHLEELYWRGSIYSTVSNLPLLVALIGSSNKAPLCRSLRYLVMETANRTGMMPGEADRLESQLRSIAYRRYANEPLAPLTVVWDWGEGTLKLCGAKKFVTPLP